MTISVFVDDPVAGSVMEVPSNGGCVVILTVDGSTIYLPGYGAPAATHARELAKQLIDAALTIEAADVVEVEPSSIQDETTL